MNMVPAHVWHLFVSLWKALAPSIKMAQARLFRSLPAAGQKPLHAHANPQERHPPGNCLSHGRSDPGLVQPARSREMTHARQDHKAGCIYVFRTIRYRDLGVQIAQCLDDRSQVAGPVVDDGNGYHSNPLVLGNISPSCLSREQATRSARANALKRASILWWFDRPYMVMTCTLARAPRANPSKKSSTSSLCKSPTRRFFTLVLTTQDTRPLKSTAATPNVSSIGIRKYPARRIPFLSPSA